MVTSNGSFFDISNRNWIVQQRDLSQLTQAITEHPLNTYTLQTLAENKLNHFKDYQDQRLAYLRLYPASRAPTASYTLSEIFNLWMVGCRPSRFVRLAYALYDSRMEPNLAEHDNLQKLSADQLTYLDELCGKVSQSEIELSDKLRSMQDERFVEICKHIGWENNSADCENGVFEVLDAMALDWLSIVEEADSLRLNTLKDIVQSLSPLQAAEFLLAGKNLNMSNVNFDG